MKKEWRFLPILAALVLVTVLVVVLAGMIQRPGAGGPAAVPPAEGYPGPEEDGPTPEAPTLETLYPEATLPPGAVLIPTPIGGGIPGVIAGPTSTPFPTFPPPPTPTRRPGPSSTPLPPPQPAQDAAGLILYVVRSGHGMGQNGFQSTGDLQSLQTDPAGLVASVQPQVVQTGWLQMIPSLDNRRTALLESTMLGDIVEIFDPITGMVEPMRESTFYGGFFQGWHPDSRQILYVADGGDIAYGGLWLFDYVGGVETFLAAADPGILIRSATVSPDGQSVVYYAEEGVHSPGGLWQINADGSEPQPYGDDFSPAYGLSWSPSGDWITYFGFQGLTIMRPDGTEQRVLATDGVVGARLMWSPDGRYLVYVAGEAGPLPDDQDCLAQPPDPALVDWDRRAFCATTIHVIDITNWDNRALLSPVASGKVEGSIDPTWSPDGHSLAFASLRGEQAGLWVVNLDGSNLRQVAQSIDLIRYPVWLRQ